MRYAAIVLIILTSMFLVSCTNQKQEHTTITISISPWVGFYPLYFAIEKGIVEQNGVDLRIVETMTAADFARTNIKRHIDAIASSPMELLKANKILQEPLTIAFFVDYSNGADVIVARKDIKTMDDLKGKKVGYETNSLEHLFLNLALQSTSMSSSDIEAVNVGQISASEMFDENKLDAYSTFPPTSNLLLERGDLHVVFDSGKIPYMILDLVFIKQSRIHKLDPLQNIWFEVTEYIRQNPEEYMQFLAKIMNVPVGSAQQDFEGIKVIGEKQQSEITLGRILAVIQETCAILSEKVSDCHNGLRKIYWNSKPLKSSSQ